MKAFSRWSGACRTFSAILRDEYRMRIATFHGLAEVFHEEHVSAGQSDGSGKEWFWGGGDPVMARTIAEAVNLALDLIAQ